MYRTRPAAPLAFAAAVLGVANAGAQPRTTALSERDTVVEHGDTLTWIRAEDVRARGVARTDTIVVLLRRDSAFLLRPYRNGALPPRIAKQMFRLRSTAQVQRDLDAKFTAPNVPSRRRASS